MIGRLFTVMASGLALCLVSAAAQAAVEIGKPAPPFTGTSAAGQSVSLGDLAGKTVVLEWTNHDCPFVKKHYDSGNMQSLQKELTGKGAVWLTVISSAPGKQGHVSPAKANDLTQSRNAAPSDVILDEDGTIGMAYGATATPQMVVITPQQIVAYNGAIDSIPSAKQDDIPKAQNYVRAAYDAVAAGKPVQVAQTKAYGCSVKYP
ncbi:redoxin domain-containing protein [Emcibacter sp. SYSU 3D8]|uniref:redoxin domain-containing protein n=1 Tax=Emcibacter sp. SYSU 3D8 TaxID=3133969 RepID=UPI0031FE7372